MKKMQWILYLFLKQYQLENLRGISTEIAPGISIGVLPRIFLPENLEGFLQGLIEWFYLKLPPGILLGIFLVIIFGTRVRIYPRISLMGHQNFLMIFHQKPLGEFLLRYLLEFIQAFVGLQKHLLRSLLKKIFKVFLIFFRKLLHIFFHFFHVLRQAFSKRFLQKSLMSYSEFTRDYFS